MNIQEMHKKCLADPRNKELWSIYSDMLETEGFEDVAEFIKININYEIEHIHRVKKLHDLFIYELRFYTNMFPNLFFDMNLMIDYCNVYDGRESYFLRIIYERTSIHCNYYLATQLSLSAMDQRSALTSRYSTGQLGPKGFFGGLF